MEGGRENNACFSVPSPSQVTWDGVHFGGSRAFPKSPCLQSIREKKKSRCAVSSLQGSKRRQAVRISALPELPPELCYANSHEFLDLFFFFWQLHSTIPFKGNSIVKNSQMDRKGEYLDWTFQRRVTFIYSFIQSSIYCRPTMCQALF